MYFTHYFEKDKLAIALHGEIDHHSVKTLRYETDSLIASLQPSCLIIDMSDIEFCDSSGLGFIMGRYKKITGIGGTMYICDPSDAVRKILTLSGMDKLIKIHDGR